MNAIKKQNINKNNAQLKYDWAAEIAKLISDDKPVFWSKPWAPADMPQNLESGKAYKGKNAALLAAAMSIHGYDDCRFLTFQQAKKAGGNVKKGEKGFKITMYREFLKEPEKEGEKPLLMHALKFWTVFNAEQCEGLPAAEIKGNTDFKINDVVENLAGNLAVKIINRTSNHAYFSKHDNTITLPRKEQFREENRYYYTLLHEIIHWTGGADNLGRDLTGIFGSENYAREELVAEIGSFLLGLELGIGFYPSEHCIAYLKGWSKKIKDDSGYLKTAVTNATAAVNFVLKQAGIK